MKRFITAALAGLFSSVLITAALAAEYRGVPPNMIGLMLTPSGFDGKIYTPGIVDIGNDSTWTSGSYGNKLLLIQRSGVFVKEQFLEHEDGDKEDHRCIVGPNREPMTLDVRLLFALPDYGTEDGKQALLRLGLLGNPTPYPDPDTVGGDRVMLLDAASVYAQQVRTQVRGKIRDVCIDYESVEAVFKAVELNNTPEGFTTAVEKAVGTVLAETDSPLLLVDAVVSNIKPDSSVIDAIVAKKAAGELVQAMTAIDDFIKEDNSGMRAYIFKMMVMQGIVKNSGGNTMFMTDIGAGKEIIPIAPK